MPVFKFKLSNFIEQELQIFVVSAYPILWKILSSISRPDHRSLFERSFRCMSGV
jgi:hypothetical protein